MTDGERMPLTQPAIDTERETLVKQVQDWLELPMLVLAFMWLALFLVETIWGLSPFLEAAGLVIWAVFVLDFALGLVLSPRRLDFLKSN
jgi:voltage-gated potassium channel